MYTYIIIDLLINIYNVKHVSNITTIIKFNFCVVQMTEISQNGFAS